MKLIKYAIINTVSIIAVILSTNISAFASELVTVRVQEIFVPNGFDDNDNTVLVLDGHLTSSCMELAHHDVSIDEATRTIFITQFARRTAKPCLPVLVPYAIDVELGILPFGDYEIEEWGGTRAHLSVAESNNAGPDDHMYAQIEDVRIEEDTSTGTLMAIIQGTFPSNCTVWKEVVHIDSGKTQEVLPIVETIDGPGCLDQRIPFSWLIDLPDDVIEGRYLLHVRSANGGWYNRMYSTF